MAAAQGVIFVALDREDLIALRLYHQSADRLAQVAGPQVRFSPCGRLAQVASCRVIRPRSQASVINGFQVGAQLRFFHLVFFQQGAIDGAQLAAVADQLPDAGAHRVQAEIALALQIQQHGLTRDFLGDHIGRKDYGLIEVHVVIR